MDAMRNLMDQAMKGSLFTQVFGNHFVHTSLGVLLAYALTSRINGMLNDRAYHNSSTSHPWSWGKEIVLITGGCSGIGALIAQKLASQSIKVIILDIRPPEVQLPAGVFFYKVDVSSEESVRAAAEKLREEVGHPTVLVNNAATGFQGTVLSTKVDEIRRTFDVNTVAHFILAKEFVPHMVEMDHGHVVTVASMASFVTIAGVVAYSCTKASSMAFHEGLRQELLHRHNARHVRTSIIHPFWVRTPMTAHYHDKVTSELLEPEMVADTIVRHILKGKSGVVLIASALWTAPLVRGLPSWIQERIRGAYSSIIPS